MNEYYRQEFLLEAQKWTRERLETYIQELEDRVRYTKEHIRALKTLRKRKNRSAKDSGQRGG